MATSDGGPAFPTAFPAVHVPAQGMSLRDYFAGQALLGLCTDYIPERRIPSGVYEGQTEKTVIGIRAYAIADAMLQARAESGEPRNGGEG